MWEVTTNVKKVTQVTSVFELAELHISRDGLSGRVEFAMKGDPANLIPEASLALSSDDVTTILSNTALFNLIKARAKATNFFSSGVAKT